MNSGRFIGVMSGTSLDGVDVVLAAIDDHVVAQQASLSYPVPLALKEAILAICQGSSSHFRNMVSLIPARAIFCRRRAGADAAGAAVGERCGGDRLPRPDCVARARRRRAPYAANRR